MAFERRGQRKWSKTSYRTGRKKDDTDGESVRGGGREMRVKEEEKKDGY